MKLIMLAVIILFGCLCVSDEVKHQNNKQHIAALIIIYALMGVVMLT